jgi:hypothetical protein
MFLDFQTETLSIHRQASPVALENVAVLTRVEIAPRTNPIHPERALVDKI